MAGLFPNVALVQGGGSKKPKLVTQIKVQQEGGRPDKLEMQSVQVREGAENLPSSALRR